MMGRKKGHVQVAARSLVEERGVVVINQRPDEKLRNLTATLRSLPQGSFRSILMSDRGESPRRGISTVLEHDGLQMRAY